MSGWFDDSLHGSDRGRDREAGVKSRLTVGHAYPELATGENGYILSYVDGELLLYALSCGWQAEAVLEYAPAKGISWHWTELAGMGFLCVKFGDLPWGDCPFHPGFYKTLLGRELLFPEIGDFKGLTVAVICVDSTTGKVIHIRKVSLPKKFSEAWVGRLSLMAQDALSESEYQNRVCAVTNAYMPSQLAAQAVLRYTLIPREKSNDNHG